LDFFLDFCLLPSSAKVCSASIVCLEKLLHKGIKVISRFNMLRIRNQVPKFVD
jgi:hypothetical protein